MKYFLQVATVNELWTPTSSNVQVPCGFTCILLSEDRTEMFTAEEASRAYNRLLADGWNVVPEINRVRNIEFMLGRAVWILYKSCQAVVCSSVEDQFADSLATEEMKDIEYFRNALAAVHKAARS